jgi:hypothetical protein
VIQQTTAETTAAADPDTVAIAPKKRRNKIVMPDQGLLGGMAEGSGWALSRPSQEGIAGAGMAKAKGKGRKKALKADGGEEAEKKDMAKRAKVEKQKKTSTTSTTAPTMTMGANGLPRSRHGHPDPDGDTEVVGMCIACERKKHLC